MVCAGLAYECFDACSGRDGNRCDYRDPNTSVRALAALLSQRGISGVPVVDSDNRLIGIVSEGDLLHRVETGTERQPERLTGPRRSWWLDAIASNQDLARDYVKSHGRTVKDVMTPDVISVADTTELAEIAMMLETKRIKRVLVARDGKLVGIVSRANLVRALATAKSEPAANADNDDRTIREKLLSELKGQKWFEMQEWFKIWASDIIVRDRVVHFWLCDNQSEEERRALRVAAENRRRSACRRAHRPGATAHRSEVRPSQSPPR
jgi:CBS domain-containing protein